jgi:hypothetical protein
VEGLIGEVAELIVGGDQGPDRGGVVPDRLEDVRVVVEGSPPRRGDDRSGGRPRWRQAGRGDLLGEPGESGEVEAGDGVRPVVGQSVRREMPPSHDTGDVVGQQQGDRRHGVGGLGSSDGAAKGIERRATVPSRDHP